MSDMSPSAQPVPRSPEVQHWLYENAFIGETMRVRQLERYEAHYTGLQYAHLQLDWWGFSADQMETISSEVNVPYGFTQPAIAASVKHKRPTAPFQLCTSVVDRFTGLLFSDARKPEIAVEGDPDTEDFLFAVMEQARFWAKVREARTIGGALGSVLVTAHLRNGKFSVEAHNPRHIALIKWADFGTFQPGGILKQYKTLREEDELDPKTGQPTGRSIVVEYLYRRIITDKVDIIFKPARLDDPTAPIQWEIESQVEHNLGFFPGVWVQNLPVLDDYDGRPDCDGAWQSFDTIDRMTSQMNKALLLNLDPTVVLKVQQKIIEMDTLRKGSENALNVGHDGDAKYMEMTGAALEKADSFVKRIIEHVLHVVRCVLVDPATISGAAQSAKAIEYIYAPMLEKADDLRAQYGELLVKPVLEIIVKIAKAMGGKKIKLPGGAEAVLGFDLPPRVAERPTPKNAPSDFKPEVDLIPRKLGDGGHIRVKWGPYFAPTESDRQLAVANLVAAKASPLLDEETAVRQACAIFGVKDPQLVLQRIRDQQKEEIDRAMAMVPGGEPGDVDELPPAREPEPAKRPEPPEPGAEAEDRDKPAGKGGKP